MEQTGYILSINIKMSTTPGFGVVLIFWLSGEIWFVEGVTAINQ
ncbi:hypothetical protein [Pediococcus argentinicus]|nr:hypothetical protein [Pediococcus argentinicus]